MEHIFSIFYWYNSSSIFWSCNETSGADSPCCDRHHPNGKRDVAGYIALGGVRISQSLQDFMVTWSPGSALSWCRLFYETRATLNEDLLRLVQEGKLRLPLPETLFRLLQWAQTSCWSGYPGSSQGHGGSALCDEALLKAWMSGGERMHMLSYWSHTKMSHIKNVGLFFCPLQCQSEKGKKKKHFLH